MNQYTESLNKWEKLQQDYDRINNAYDQGNDSEGSMVAFMLRLKETYPLMFALEQRDECRQMFRLISTRLNSIRRDKGQKSFIGSRDWGLEGCFERSDIINEEVHKGKPVLTLNVLEEKARGK